jgi:hypothetical protein
MLLLVTAALLVAASCLLARVSGDFAYGCGRVVEALSGFFEFKAALRNARSAGTRRASGVQRGAAYGA